MQTPEAVFAFGFKLWALSYIPGTYDNKFAIKKILI
jgi:hypothetical protein